MSYLQFQDFTDSDSPFTNPKQSSDYQKPILTHELSSGNLSTDTSATAAKKPHFLTFQFYQQYFDVDTSQVQTRILNSMIPRRNANFITDHIQPSPDLYGPFWICVTLIFSTAICGNFVRYAQRTGPAEEDYESDFSLVTGSTTIVTSYVLFVPFAIYSLLWYRKAMVQYSYMELLCAYGYSLSIFVPVSVLWLVQIQWFRWLLIVVSVVLSGTVLLSSLWPSIKSESNRLIAFGFIAGVLLFHGLLAVTFKEFYFDTVMPSQQRIQVNNNILQDNQQALTDLTTLAPALKEGKEIPAVLPPAAALMAANSSQDQVKSGRVVENAEQLGSEVVTTSTAPAIPSANETEKAKQAEDPKQ